ncbi:hypothetical protein DSL64_26700 [Dyadobacter luteus]|uniref:HTH araC/xylS-type domain-containing protein n=1 Tax=Dyadobacter luteus TaxID=2259619 RepID=A0A3D8Y3C8_9BACT|nr:AraC family transcriptional regulator [Dyadobacter luteus]REA56510.1 hypothetical protein DSL64_26700 [Dyadobacter luteus]
MTQKFQEIVLKRLEPAQYIKYLNLTGKTNKINPNYSFSDSQFFRSEIFYEKINNNFWITIEETEEQFDTCYTIPAQKTKSEYFSINYYQSQNYFGYQSDDQVVYVKDIVIFSGPKSTHKIYVSQKSPLRCYRLILSKPYLQRFLNLNLSNSRLNKAHFLVATGEGVMVRPIHDIEKIVTDRLYALLKYRDSTANHALSLTANAFNITDQFFRLSNTTAPSIRLPDDDDDLINRIVHHLEENIKNKFPGIEAIASDFYISPTKLKKIFRTFFNTTPLLYFRKLQINYAQKKMEITKVTVKELASELGFKKSNTFSIWFKRYVGKNPNELQ